MRDKSRKLSEVAYKALKNKIINMSGGSYISARQFADEIGISYTPVREAFLRVQKEGSLKLVPNVGFFVESLGITDLIQIFQVRECIETFVLDKVFDRITKDHIKRMKEISAKQSEELSRNRIFEYQLLDIKFHEILFVLYGNRPLLNFYRDIRDQYMICSKEIATVHSQNAVLEHANYFTCLESGDKEQAIDCLKNHINHARERMTEGYISVIEGGT
jgi:DNA-binding GntR family transcriptional regulator